MEYHFTGQDLDEIIEYTKALSQSHPNLQERAKAKLAIAFANMMDETTPGWRLAMAASIDNKRAYERFPKNVALDVVFKQPTVKVGDITYKPT